MNSKRQYTLLIAFGNLGIGGIQTKIVSLTDHLAQTRGDEIHVNLILRDTPVFNQISKLNLESVTIHIRPQLHIGPFCIPFTLYLLWKIILLQPNIILTFHDILSSVAVVTSGIVFWKKMHVVLNEDTLPSAHTQIPYKKLMIRTFYPYADRIILPTLAAQTDLITRFGVPASKTVVIPNWTLMPPPRETHKKKYDLLYIGRFVKQKNTRFLLRVLKRLLRKIPGLTLCLVGEGPEKSSITEYISRHRLSPHVTVQNSDHNITKYLDSTKLFVLSSHYEGMPLAVLEAMARGCAIVALRYPGLSECVISGKTGYIAGSVDDFAQKVAFLLTHSAIRIRMGKTARNVVKSKYSQKPLSRYAKILTQLR